MNCEYGRYLRILCLGLCGSSLLAGFAVDAASQDTDYSYPPPLNSVAELRFLSSTQGWMLAYKNQKEYLLRTSNAGKTWTSIALPDKFYQVFFTNPSDGWGLTSQPMGDGQAEFTLERTRDGGTTWERVYKTPRDVRFISDLLIKDGLQVWLAGDLGTDGSVVFYSADGGNQVARVRTSAGTGSSFLADDRKTGVILFTTDGIFDCVPALPPRCEKAQVDAGETPVKVQRGFVGANGTGWAAGQDRIFKTEDFGRTWRTQSRQDNWQDLTFLDDKHGCAITWSWTVLCTDDGGISWKQNPSPPKSPRIKSKPHVEDDLRTIVVLPNQVWIVTSAGFLYRRTDTERWLRLDPFQLTGEPNRLGKASASAVNGSAEQFPP